MIEHEGTQTRGFLFADIRGYTEYLERYGAAAAAELLARYRAIVRATVAEHRGAEIRTEGDSFYVVLPTASAAVRCALAIVERVESENVREPAHAIRVGIGVHAGEAIETGEGLVGSAINIAARLSALARPGEVLLSETVRTLTRSVIPVRYVPRGRHRLKGVAEPQEVFAAQPAGAPVVRVRTGRRTAVAASTTVVVLVLIVILAYVAWPAGANPGALASSSVPPSANVASPTSVAYVSPTTPLLTPTTTPISSPAPTGPTIIHFEPISPLVGGWPLLAPGTYRWNSFRPILVFRVDPSSTDRSWYPVVDASDFAWLVGARAGVDPAFDDRARMRQSLTFLAFARVQTVVGNACNPGDTSSYQLLGGRPRDVVDWLSSHRFLSASNLQPVELAGWSGLSVDVTVKGDPGMECSALERPHQGSVTVFKTTAQGAGYGGIYKIFDGEEARFVVLDIGGEIPLVLISKSLVGDFATRILWAQDLINTMTSLPQ